MPLPLPDLDDRTFDDLINAARQQIAQTTQGEWTGSSPGDPGVVLLELYAFLTETMIYRLNRLPDKVYVALLNLLGVALRPPSAASVTLQFSLSPDRPAAQAVTISRGTAVESSQRDASGQPVVFRTIQQVVIPAGQTGARVLAYHYEQVEGELLGLGAGMAGLSFKVAAPPIINPPAEMENTLIVGVEARPNQPPNGLPERAYQGKTYQLWRQVDNFTDLLAYPYAYVVDRMSGAIRFAPAQGWENGLPPAVPANGKKIMAWYWYRPDPGEQAESGPQQNASYGEVNEHPLGTGTGEPGLVFELPHQAIIGQTLTLAVQAGPGEQVEPGALRVVAGETYRVWREVDDLAQLHPLPYVFCLDRDGRTVRFADPDELDQAQAHADQRRAHIPPAGQEIRAWYWSGGGTGVPGGAPGSAGNVPAGSLTTLRTPVPGVRLSVTNPGPASGGYDAETLAEALIRGPQELYTLPHGAITARDFERLALRSSPAIARAQALTQAELWKQALPGTVEVLLVPDLPGIPKAQRGSGQINAQVLDGQRSSTTLETCRASLEARRPLGTHCAVNWTSYKTVRVRARIFVNQEENAVTVRDRVLRRLHEHINPLPTAAGPGWPFGKPLQASDVYNIALAEPGVRWVDQVGLELDDVPEKNVTSLAADCFEPGAWYAGSGSVLFRSRNDGEGWEPAHRFDGQTIRLVRSHPRKAGHVVVLARSDQDGEMRLHLSRKYGETWEEADIFPPRYETGEAITDVNDLVWSLGDPPAVLIATERGLYRVELNNAEPGQPVLLEPPAGNGRPPAPRPVYAVAAARTAVASTETVWVAAVTQDGVYVSDNGGISFERRVEGLLGEDIQKLAFQEANGVYLWAGTAAAGGQEGQGCLRLRLLLGTGSAEKWVSFGPGQGWRGGSCNNLAFWGPWVLAATHHQGVLMLNTSAAVWASQDAPDPAAGKAGRARREAAGQTAGQSGLPRWKVPDVETCGLPPRGEPGPFQPVMALATNWSPDSPPAQPVILAGIVREIEREAGEGVYRSLNQGDTYEFLSRHVFNERVTLPPTWLFVSGSHEVTVAYEGQEGL